MTTTPAPVDPAEAAELATELAGPAVAGQFTAAAIRDFCRRAAYDMGIGGREAHPDMLPVIAAEAADRLRREARGTLSRVYRDQLEVLLLPAGWRRRFDSFEKQDGASFDLSFKDAETITVFLSRDNVAPSIVETFHLDASNTPPARLARIITAATA
jgi:hypothetical protein